VFTDRCSLKFFNLAVVYLVIDPMYLVRTNAEIDSVPVKESADRSGVKVYMGRNWRESHPIDLSTEYQ
jgi:hypothetical protein